MTFDHQLTALTAQGLLVPRALADVRERLGVPGSPAPDRTLEVRLAGGLSVDVLPGRGLDLGDATLRGIPLSWVSPVSDGRALAMPRGTDWLSRFTGGLLATCGLENIGPATGEHGLHGDIGHRPASNVVWRTDSTEHGARVTVEGVVEAVSLFGPSYRLERTITVGAGPANSAVVTLTDHITNVGSEPAPVALLYHVNFGAPLVVPGTTVDVRAARVRAREPRTEVPDVREFPRPAVHTVEAVFEHVHPVVDETGWAAAVVASPDGSMRAKIEWEARTLPRLYQWVFPTRGRWALGIEPASAPLFGDERDASATGAPLLAPGDVHRSRLRISFELA